MKIPTGKEKLKRNIDLKNQIEFIYMKNTTTENLKLSEHAWQCMIQGRKENLKTGRNYSQYSTQREKYGKYNREGKRFSKNV